MLELDKEKMMFNQNNGPLEHLAANALALLAGASGCYRCSTGTLQDSASLITTPGENHEAHL